MVDRENGDPGTSQQYAGCLQVDFIKCVSEFLTKKATMNFPKAVETF